MFFLNKKQMPPTLYPKKDQGFVEKYETELLILTGILIILLVFFVAYSIVPFSYNNGVENAYKWV